MLGILTELRAGAAMGRRDYARVVKLCEAALRKNPSDTAAMLMLANARERLGDRDAAFEVYRQIAAVEPSNVLALRGIAEHYAAAAQYRAACDAIRRALAAADRPRPDEGRFARWFYRVSGIQAKLDEAARRSDEQWRRWAHTVLSAHGAAAHYEVPRS